MWGSLVLIGWGRYKNLTFCLPCYCYEPTPLTFPILVTGKVSIFISFYYFFFNLCKKEKNIKYNDFYIENLKSENKFEIAYKSNLLILNLWNMLSLICKIGKIVWSILLFQMKDLLPRISLKNGCDGFIKLIVALNWILID